MASRKKDDAAELAAKLVQTLVSLAGTPEYPTTLEKLAKQTDPSASSKSILSAVSPRRREFSFLAVVARADLRAPAALLDHLPQLAESPALLEFALTAARTNSNVAFSVSALRAKVTTKLQKPFQEAVNRQLQEGSLPATVGWLIINRSKKLFLLEDLHRGQGSAPVLTPLPQPTGEFCQAFDAAFARLDQQSGGYNFVNLGELRRALPMPRELFDAELNHLRRAGRYSLSAAEGRHGLGSEDREAGIIEDGTLLLFVSRRIS